MLSVGSMVRPCNNGIITENNELLHFKLSSSCCIHVLLAFLRVGLSISDSKASVSVFSLVSCVRPLFLCQLTARGVCAVSCSTLISLLAKHHILLRKC